MLLEIGDRRQKLLGDSNQGITGPRGVPIDGAAIHQRWELPNACAPAIADGRKAHDNRDQCLTLLDEEGIELCRCSIRSFALVPGGVANHLAHCNLFVRREQIWNLTGVQEVVDVLHKALLLDLRVAEQEHGLLAIPTSLREHFLHVLPERHDVVAFRNLDLVHRHIRHEASKPGATLPARAADPDKQRIAAWALDDSSNAAEVL
mmetsp:Transcript_49837/g.161249  ORF Transcript_49837/g.161249 Transcript_49837/m.161249 type:complete len:205 (+) Transcript_49837:4569-5183(+)